VAGFTSHAVLGFRVPSFPFLSLWDDHGHREAGMTAHSAETHLLRHGPLRSSSVCANCLCIIDALRCPARGRCVVPCTVYLYVQHSCKFHWLLGLYTLHLTGTPSCPSSTCHPSQVIV